MASERRAVEGDNQGSQQNRRRENA
jgi:small subunit ribosomal protein S3